MTFGMDFAIILLTSATISAIVSVIMGYLLRGKAWNMQGEVVEPSTRVTAVDLEPDDTPESEVMDTSLWEFRDVPSEKDQDEIAWAREKGFLDPEDVDIADRLSGRVARMGGRG